MANRRIATQRCSRGCLVTDMSLLFKDNTQEELDDLALRVEELSQRLGELWARITGSSGEASRSGGARGSGIDSLFGISLESLARRTGYQIAGGESLDVVVRTAVRQVERAAGRRLERLLAGKLGYGLLASLAGGGALALLDAGFAAITRLFKKRRLDLPRLEERPYGGFPRFAERTRLIPPGAERDDRLERELVGMLARSIAEEK